MIICKSAKTPYNANKWILGALSKWEYGGCLLYAYISHVFIYLWCTPMYIECFQCVIDKCYHYWLTSKIFDMVSAGGSRTTVLYAIEFHTTDFSFEHMNNCSYVVYDFGCMQFNCAVLQDLSYWEYFSVNQLYIVMSTIERQNIGICTRLPTNAT